jgi:hypothetical protein
MMSTFLTNFDYLFYLVATSRQNLLLFKFVDAFQAFKYNSKSTSSWMGEI